MASALRALARRAAPALLSSRGGAPRSFAKTSTGIVGLEVVPNGREVLMALSEKLIGMVGTLPESAHYRRNVEAVYRGRLDACRANTEVEAIEAAVGQGQIEELIRMARDEEKLIPKMAGAWRAERRRGRGRDGGHSGVQAEGLRCLCRTQQLRQPTPRLARHAPRSDAGGRAACSAAALRTAACALRAHARVRTRRTLGLRTRATHALTPLAHPLPLRRVEAVGGAGGAHHPRQHREGGAASEGGDILSAALLMPRRFRSSAFVGANATQLASHGG
jgi:NADH dehydrogenase (ubiquinone) 1 alpha subcomplex subunit 5